MLIPRKDFIFTGREAMLDEVKFVAGGWPTINQGQRSERAGGFALWYRTAKSGTGV